MRVSLLSVVLLLAPSVATPQSYWQQFVQYTMHVKLHPEKRLLTGTETIVYRNNSPDTLRQFFLHLYPNAYRGPESIYAREARRHFQDVAPKPEEAGYLNVERLRVRTPGRGDGPGALVAFKVDDTVLEATLPRPLPPGGEIQLDLTFELKIRAFARRAGYRDHQFDFAQWYPKVCVYDETGWNAEPFHFQGEFYGEFGTFDVTIEVPFDYIVAATGVVTAGDPGWEAVRWVEKVPPEAWQARLQQTRTALRQQAEAGKVRTVRFWAENVHDFAWLTSPDFVYERGDWQGIPIHVLYRTRMQERWRRVVVERGRRALSWLSEKFGRYPYPQLTIAHGLLGGGMEYPMLVMNSSESEGLILHEVGHIYFYGILANNEWKEAWLDEGFTSFQTRWYLETRYGRWGYNRDEQLRTANWLQKRRPRKTSREASRDRVLDYLDSGHNEPISRYAYRFKEPSAYGVNAYTKGAFFYDMLKYVVGDSAFEAICHAYFDRWRFKHVNEARFQQVCEEVSGQELDWFFHQWLHDSVTVDYAIADVKKQQTGGRWTTEVTVLRKARGKMPVEVELTTAGGEKLVRRWDGQDRLGVVRFESDAKPVRVVLDPRDAILDRNRLNNGPLRLQFLFEYPNMNYAPRDAYLITWRPSGWYNKADKLRVGGRMRGSHGRFRNAELGLWYGFDSRQLDVRFRYANPIRALGKDVRGSLLVQKMEGRFEVDAHLLFRKGAYWSRPPHHVLQVGFNHTRLLDLDGKGPRYTLRDYDQKERLTVQSWEKGDVNKLYLHYRFNPRGLRWFAKLRLGLEAVLDDWGADFNYANFFADLRLSWPRPDEGLAVRLLAQKIANAEDAPLQELLFLEGANPRQRFEQFYTRSHGALPAALHYHLPGGPNLRGYYNQPITGDRAFALNVTYQRHLSGRLVEKARSVLGRVSVAGFADMAAFGFLDESSRFYANAGVGLRFHKVLPDNWYTILTHGRDLKLRVDFPLWVNRPLADEKPVRFRWVVSVQQAI